MSRINTNIQSLMAVHNLNKANDDLAQSLARLSSGLRINTAADDPSGLIVSEALRGEKASIAQAIENSTRAGNIVGTAEAALSEVSALLVGIKDLVTEAANSGALSDAELDANQLAIDSAVSSITRIAKTTRFSGQYLLNGNLAYRTSGVTASQLAGVKLYGVEFGGSSNVAVSVAVTTSAQAGTLDIAASSITEDVTFEVRGNLGSEVLSFTSSTDTSSIAAAINTFTDATGVSATVVSASKISLYSDTFGSDAFVAVNEVSGSVTGLSGTYDAGQDAAGTINNVTAVGDGLNLSLKTTVLDLKVTLDDGFGTGTSTFRVTGGGATFQLGSVIDPNGQVRMGIDSVTAGNLGNGNVGYLSSIVTGGDNSILDGGAGTAAKILDTVISDVASLRGRLGAFVSNTVQSSVDSLQVALENVTAAESLIRDADFTVEAAGLTRAQVLVNAGTSVLAIANATPQYALALLG